MQSQVFICFGATTDSYGKPAVYCNFISNQHIQVKYRKSTLGEHKRMKKAHILSLILIVILIVATISLLVSYSQSSNPKKNPVYVGVAFCGNTTDQAKLLIDRVKSYTNLFILDCGINPISDNLTAAREICDYAINCWIYIYSEFGHLDSEMLGLGKFNSSMNPNTYMATSFWASTTMMNQQESKSITIGQKCSMKTALTSLVPQVGP